MKKGICKVFYFNPKKTEKVKKEVPPAETTFGLAQLLQVSSNAPRVKIVSVLAPQELCTCDQVNFLTFLFQPSLTRSKY
jgi:hypothetical protein